jgi:multicomponent Na+:H+ antiporter subunit B
VSSEFIVSLITIPLFLLLVATAVTVARMRDLWGAVMLTGIYSFLGATWMLLLDAPDVAFTEAAVGAGISTVLMLATLSLTGREAKAARQFPWIPLVVVTVTGAALIYGTLDLPRLGDPDAPIHRYPASPQTYIERSQREMHGIPNVVTAVLGSYRGYDTLGETTVVFTAGVGVLTLLRGKAQREGETNAS